MRNIVCWLTAFVVSQASIVMGDNLVVHRGAGAVAAYTRCVPATGTDLFCETFTIQFDQFSNTRSGVPPNAHNLSLGYERDSAIIHADGSLDEYPPEFGSLGAAGDFDRARLRSAWTAGGVIALFIFDETTGQFIPTGRTVTLGPFAWTSASSPYVFGNDGPFSFGLPRFYRDRCLTAVSNAHNRFTTAHVTGTIDGISVSDPQFEMAYLPWPGTGPDDARGAIFDNVFDITQQAHGGIDCVSWNWP